MLATMPRTTLTGSLPGKSIDDVATMQDFVRVLVEIAVADYTAEQLFADDALNDCLRLVLGKNLGLYDFGGTPWPEDRLTRAVRSELDALRATMRH